jgi:protein-L-isoaspartate(D-aspartate) O-methyltransferase
MITDTLEQARFNMVQQQIRPWEVLDQRVLDLMQQIPRDPFVPDAYRNLAYADIEIPIGHGQRMMFPRVEGRMLQALNIQPDDRILEIGTGSGYVTACLAKLGREVISLEIHPEFTEQALARLEVQGIKNVALRSGDGLADRIDGAPFDLIALTGSLPQLPESLERQLNLDGRLFAVIGQAPTMEATLITRVGEESWRSEGLFETVLAPLENVQEGSRFTF